MEALDFTFERREKLIRRDSLEEGLITHFAISNLNTGGITNPTSSDPHEDSFLPVLI